MQLKIVSFNMKYTASAKHSWNCRADAICSFLKAEEPDIIGTQEMVKSYIEESEKLWPEYGWVGEGRRGGDEGEFTAIFYRKDKFRAIQWGTFWLSKTPLVPGSRSWFSLFPRTCTWAVLEVIETGRRLCVYNTHLDHISMFARLNGLNLIRKHIADQLADCPDVVLMGDFNAFPESRPLRQLRGDRSPLVDSYRVNLSGASGRTYHGFRGRIDGRPVDYIFASNTLSVEKAYIDRQTYDNRYPSDHYPVIVVANMQGKEAALAKIPAAGYTMA